MKWSLLELRKYHEEPLVFQETLNLKEELLKREKEIIDIAPIEVEGMITVTPKEYLLHYSLKTMITLPSTRSLEPVELPMAFIVDEVFMTTEQFQRIDDLVKAEEILILENQTLDLDESVADNILLQIPLQVLSEEEKESEHYPSGNDWVVYSEADYEQLRESKAESTIDPRLAKLTRLFEKAEEENE